MAYLIGHVATYIYIVSGHVRVVTQVGGFAILVADDHWYVVAANVSHGMCLPAQWSDPIEIGSRFGGYEHVVFPFGDIIH